MANLGNLCLSEAWSCQCRCCFHGIAVLLYVLQGFFLFIGFQRCHAESQCREVLDGIFFSSRLWASATLNGINLVEVAERAAVRMHEPDFLEASPQGVLEIRAGDQTASKYDPFQCPARDVSAKHFTHFYKLIKDL